MLKKLYLVRLFRQNKIMFIFVLIFIFFQGLFNYKKAHSFPWYVWDMYSRPQTIADTITQTEIFIDNKRMDITSIPIWQEATILNTYKMYNWMRMNNYNDPMQEVVKNRTIYFSEKTRSFIAYKINNHKEETIQYPRWLLHYLETITDKEIREVALRDVQYKLENNAYVPIDNSWEVLKITK